MFESIARAMDALSPPSAGGGDEGVEPTAGEGHTEPPTGSAPAPARRLTIEATYEL